MVENGESAGSFSHNVFYSSKDKSYHFYQNKSFLPKFKFSEFRRVDHFIFQVYMLPLLASVFVGINQLNCKIGPVTNFNVCLNTFPHNDTF